MSGVGQTFMWIGIHDANEDNNFVTVDGTSLDWTNWGPSQPTHTSIGRDEDGVEIRATTADTWNDAPKWMERQFACTYVRYN